VVAALTPAIDTNAAGEFVGTTRVHRWHWRPGVFDDLPAVAAPNEQALLARAHEEDGSALGQIPIRERTTDATALSWFCAATARPGEAPP
jgi:hypothetical protein